MQSLISLIEVRYPKEEDLERMIKNGTRVSLYYRGDDSTSKGWRQVSALRKETINGEDYLIVRDWGSANEEERALLVKEISNWNLLSKIKIDLDNEIRDAINNKRVITIRYRGKLENSVGTRIKIKPVAFGIRNGRKYIRAFQGGGKTVRGTPDYEPASQRRPMPGWRLFRMDRLSGWNVDATETFTDNAPSGYKQNDKFFKSSSKDIIAQAVFGKPKKISYPKKQKVAPEEEKVKKTTSIKKTEEPKSKPVRGPARPGASSSKPEDKKKKLKEARIINAIIDAVKIL